MFQLTILLPLPFAHGFDYLSNSELQRGQLVRVPFGKKTLTGIVWGKGTDDVPPEKLKSILHILPSPPLGEPFLSFLEFVAGYTLAPLGQVIKMVLPGEVFKPVKSRKKDAAERNDTPSPPALSDAQAKAAAALKETLRAGHRVLLLDGVTGSGKTEVYFDAIAHALENQKQVLMLLPEIALSVQWLSRFEKRFGFAPTLWHSEVTPAQKRASFETILQGEARVVVGARSSLFLPLSNLALIVVDEEHEPSYKQEDGVLYHARDMAVARAYYEKIPCLLVSATPSLETVSNVETGKYTALHLPARHAGASLPVMRTIDLRGNKLKANELLSVDLKAALTSQAEAGRQSLLFLNRRGFAPLLLCRSCGHRAACPDCSTWLAVHKRRKNLQCHHCGHFEPLPILCPACGAEDALYPFGPGVERLAEEVRTLLPEAKLALLSSDLTALVSPDQQPVPVKLSEAINAVTSGEAGVVIGTQMLAKGHHFPHLTLVGVVDADSGLSGGDFRAAERTYQLLHQLAGRAGREQAQGEVYLQTYQPEHPVIDALTKWDREAFLKLEKSYRSLVGMPPYGRLAALIVEGAAEIEVRNYAQALARSFHELKGEHAPPKNVFLYGPAPAPILRIRGHFRYRLLLKAPKNFVLQKLLNPWLSAIPTPRNLRLKIDIDPVSFF